MTADPRPHTEPTLTTPPAVPPVHTPSEALHGEAEMARAMVDALEDILAAERRGSVS